MGRIEKTIFISYRRTNGIWARAIYQDLVAHGYDAFYDFQSINSGDFAQNIIGNIKARAHFIVLLAPSALERCNEPGDWLRQEIETALDCKRNVVPILLEGFDFGSPETVKALTGKLAVLKNYNGLKIHSDYFEEGMARLRERFLNIALDAVLHPVSAAVDRATRVQQREASRAAAVDQTELTAQEWFEKGFKSTDAEEKIRCYTEAIHLNPDYSEAYNNRGAARNDKGDLDGALADYTEAIQLRPNYALPHRNRGSIRIEKGDFEGALADLNQAIQLKPDEPANFITRGNIYRAKQDLTHAIADYNQAIRLRPDDDDSEAYYKRGMAFSVRGDNLSALPDLQKAVKLRPNDAGKRASLIRVLKSLGKVQDAAEQERLARELVTKEREYNQAFFEAVCGNVDQALEFLKTALEKGQVTKSWARQDPDLENLRADPRFKALVE